MPDNQSLTPLKMLLFSFHATNTIIISFLPLYLEYKGLNGTEIGWVLAVGPLAAIVAQPFWGYMSDKYKTVKYILFICISGLLISSVVFFQMNSLVAILLAGFVFYFFTSPIGGLGDSLGQRRADELNISFGSIRTWGSIGFAVSSLIVGQILTEIGIQYMIWPYLFFGTVALLVTFRLTDVKVDSDPVQFRDIKMLIQNKPLMLFLFFIMFITMTHRASDSFIGLYITQLGGSEGMVGVAWFVGVASEALVFALAGRWFRKYHTLMFVIIAGILYSVRWFVYAAVNEPIYIIILQFLHGITFGVFYLAALEYVTRLIPKLLQSTGHLMFYAIFFGISGIAGSLIGGALIDSYGGGTLYAVLGYSAAAGAIFLITYHALTSKNRVREQ
ncbi:MFS transporter, PPP family, 3-phenylpropionic acid transporter [Lentibacillus halodurans]|uniref:MFS transporter, PPP family, 3-phenylpropionic acid transporter n=1 Tax=Lentibacillus halodurans TaxID=237679 RepID=A0A1I0YM26_9BACI|nr:MFS transporter [Lentibacillus halodurans]SFB14465.1 MFS transporter, PPP family, 3-phenylpropionic acid transporter [Lentibacillus halodurans]